MTTRPIDHLPDQPEVDRLTRPPVPVMTPPRRSAYYDPDSAWFDDSWADQDLVEREPTRSEAERPATPELVTV